MIHLTGHKVNACNDELQIEVVDERGAGFAHHRYDITGFDTAKNPSANAPNGYKSTFQRSIILFQNGPIPESGVNGITQEALLAILAHRLSGFQSGPFACRENAIALTHIESALLWLQKRTNDRVLRGVEGTHQV